MCTTMTAAPLDTVNRVDFFLYIIWTSQDGADTSETGCVASRDSLSRDLSKLAISPEPAATSISVSSSESPDNHDQASKLSSFGAKSYLRSPEMCSRPRQHWEYVRTARLETKIQGGPRSQSFLCIGGCSPDAPERSTNLPPRSPPETSVQLQGQLALDADAHMPSVRLGGNARAELPSIIVTAHAAEPRSIPKNDNTGSHVIVDDGDFGYREQDYCGSRTQATIPDEEDPFWEWDIERQQFRHFNENSGEMIYCPESFD